MQLVHYNKVNMLKKAAKYKELQYVPPAVSVQQAADKAIKTLRAAYEIDPGWLVYLLQHSTILLLAGLRTESPYISFSPQMWPARVTRLKNFLVKHDLCLYDGRPSFDRSRDHTVYTLYSPKLMAKLPEQYKFLQTPGLRWSAPSDASHQALVEWCFFIERNLALQMEEGTLPRKWLYDWWAPHNLRFGMLLGYPGVAISSCLWQESREKHLGHKKPLPEVFIQELDEMLGARVGFYTAKSTLKDPEVMHIYNLWTNVIKIVVDTMGALDLEHNKAFLKEFEAYKKSEGL